MQVASHIGSPNPVTIYRCKYEFVMVKSRTVLCEIWFRSERFDRGILCSLLISEEHTAFMFKVEEYNQYQCSTEKLTAACQNTRCHILDDPNHRYENQMYCAGSKYVARIPAEINGDILGFVASSQQIWRQNICHYNFLLQPS